MDYRFFYLLFLLFLLNYGNYTLAQDPVFSQFYANKLYLNPALTGYEPGTTFNLNHRNQWYKIGGNAAQFTTQSMGLGMEIPCLQSAFGLLYMDNTMGEGYLKWQSVGLSYAFRTRSSQFRHERDWELSFGLKGSYNWRSMDWDKFTFSDQFHPIHGLVSSTGLALPSNMLSSSNYFDLDAGMVFRVNLDSKQSSLNNRLRLGYAVNHLVRIDNSIVGLDDTIAMRHTIHASYVHHQSFGSNKLYQIIPMLKIDWQKTSRFSAKPLVIIDYGLAFGFQETPGLWGGMWLHTQKGILTRKHINSLILALGCEFGDHAKLSKAKNTYRLGISYDYNFSGIRSDGGGIYELSLVINFGNITLLNCRKNNKRSLPCPRF